MSSEAEVLQQGVPVGIDSGLERVNVRLFLGVKAYYKEFNAVGPHQGEVGSVLVVSVRSHEEPALVVLVYEASVDGPQPFVIGFGDLVWLHLSVKIYQVY